MCREINTNNFEIGTRYSCENFCEVFCESNQHTKIQADLLKSSNNQRFYNLCVYKNKNENSLSLKNSKGKQIWYLVNITVLNKNPFIIYSDGAMVKFYYK